MVNFIITDVPTLRLEGPLSANGTGRVEIFYKGKWGTICYKDWDIYDARVVCRQLGYAYTVKALRRGSYVPEGTGPIWLAYVNCGGNERTLSSCSHRGWGEISHCKHSDDAGVECVSLGGKIINLFCVLTICAFVKSYHDNILLYMKTLEFLSVC